MGGGAFIRLGILGARDGWSVAQLLAVALARFEPELGRTGEADVAETVSDPLLTPEQAAALLAVTPKQLETMCGAGTGPAYSKIGYKTVRYRSEDIAAYVAACRRTSMADRRA